MRLEANNVVTAVVVAIAALACVGAAGMRWWRAATERNQDLLAESVAAQELLAAAIEPAAPAGEVAPVVALRLAPESGVTETLELLHSLAEAEDVVLTSCRPIKASERGRVQFAANGHASGTALCRFLSRVENHKRLFAVSDARLRAAALDRVGFDLTIAAFHAEGAR